MAETYIYDGTHVTKVRDQTVELKESATAGQVGNSQLVIEDAAGNLTITGHKSFRVHQSACSVINVFRGFVAERTYKREGSERTANARHINLSLIDLNAKLGFKVIRGREWRKRPKESIGDRLTDLLASDFCNGIHDNGFVNYPDFELDGGDLRGQFPGDVIGEMAEHVGYNWFVYWDEGAGEASLWFQNSNTSTDWSSTLRISDVAADVDSTTTFAAAFDSTLSRSPERVISGVWLPYKKGNVYRTRQATEDTYEPRDGTAPNANVKRRRRGRNLADRYLRTHSTEEDQITTIMRQVPDTKVNLARAGQRIEAKFTSFTNEGYGDFTWFRIAERTVRPLVAEGTIYDIEVVLSPQEEAAGGGEVALVQEKHVTFETDDTLEFDDPVTIGNLLVATLVKQGTSTPGMADASWTLIGDAMAESFYGSAQSGAIAVYAKVADSTSPEIGRESVASRIQFHVYELSGASIADVTVLDLSNQPVHGLSTTADLGTFGGTGFVAWVGAFTRESAEAGQTITTGWAAGLSEDFNNYIDPDAFGNPWVSFASGVGTDINPSVVVTETIPDQLINNWGGVAVLFE